MIGLCLLVSAVALAQAPKTVKPAPKPTTKQAVGTIDSVDASSLVLTHKMAGKDVTTTFVLNADTKKEGDLAKGAKVTLHYVVANGQNIATLVKASPASAPKPAATKKK